MSVAYGYSYTKRLAFQVHRTRDTQTPLGCHRARGASSWLALGV